MLWIIIFEIILALAALLLILIRFSSTVNGAPFVVTQDKSVRVMLDLAGNVRGMKMIDLGSGDGRLVIAFAQAGADAIGYDINPWLVWRANNKVRQLGLTNARIYWRSFWGVDLKEFDIIAVYGVTYIMMRLEKKLEHEALSNAIILSNGFRLPTWEVAHEKDGVALYRLPK